MKNLTLLKTLAASVFSALALSACQTDTPTEQHYIRLSDAAVALSGEGDLAKTVKVYSVPVGWEAVAGASWLRVVNKSENSFDIEADPNEESSSRASQITVRVGEMERTVSVTQLPRDHAFHPIHINTQFQYGTVMSASGKYAGGFLYGTDEDGKYEYTPVIIDLDTDEWHEVATYPSSLLPMLQPCCISDQGLLIIETMNNGNYYFDFEGNFESITPPEGFTKKPQIASISADGVWVGWSGKDGTSYPFKWVDGVAQELPKPALNFRDEPIGDVQARGISANGKIIYGTTWDNEDYGMVYWDENNEVRYVGEDVHEVWEVERPDINGNPYKYNLANGMWTTATNYNVSPNGKWIAGTYRIESLSEEGDEVYRSDYPAFYNTETHKTTIFYDLGGGGGVTVSDDGTGFTVDSTFGPNSGKVVNAEDGTIYGTVAEWVREKFDIIIPGGYVYYYPARGDVLLGAMMFYGGAVPEGINWYLAPKR